VSLRFVQGEASKDFALPVVFDRGVYREGGTYRKGNGVTWGGSYWIAQKDDPSKPDTPDSGWRLAVKKGQNGKDLTK
jgi:integrin beta 3